MNDKVCITNIFTAFIKCKNGKNKGKLTYINLTAYNGTIYKRYSFKKCKLLERQKYLQFWNKLKLTIYNKYRIYTNLFKFLKGEKI